VRRGIFFRDFPLWARDEVAASGGEKGRALCGRQICYDMDYEHLHFSAASGRGCGDVHQLFSDAFFGGLIRLLGTLIKCMTTSMNE